MRSRLHTTIDFAGLFFVTTATMNHEFLFGSDIIRDELETKLFSFFPSHADSLMGYVIMPNHIHILVGCAKGGEQLSTFMQAFKSITARKLFSGQGTIWQVRFDGRLMQHQAQLQTRLDYIHFNPLRAGLVSNPLDWKWSSARFWSLEEKHPVLTKSWDWMER